MGVKSGDYGDHDNGPSRPIYRKFLKHCTMENHHRNYIYIYFFFIQNVL